MPAQVLSTYFPITSRKINAAKLPTTIPMISVMDRDLELDELDDVDVAVGPVTPPTPPAVFVPPDAPPVVVASTVAGAA